MSRIRINYLKRWTRLGYSVFGTLVRVFLANLRKLKLISFDVSRLNLYEGLGLRFVRSFHLILRIST